jgi:glycine cleavage system transcriptional repressor
MDAQCRLRGVESRAAGSGAPEAAVGLCARCRHARVQASRRGSVFWRCGRADREPAFARYPPLPVRACPGFAAGPREVDASPAAPLGSGAMRWYLLTAIGRDRPGLVADLARLVLECDANLEDSRMTILGTDFAVMMLCSSSSPEAGDRLAMGAKRLERDHGLTILLRHLDGPRPAVPAPGTKLYRVEAAGEDKAGIVASICGVLAAHGANIVDLSTRSRPGPGGSPHYEMRITVEIAASTEARQLREALEAEADRLVIDVALMPA